MEKDFRDAVNSTMENVLNTREYQEALSALDERIEQGKRKNALNMELAQNEQAKAENAKGAKQKNARGSEQAEALER